jgi:hypothetical protein
MKLYLAGADRSYQHLLGLDNLAFLTSYFYLRKNNSFWELVDMCNKNNIPVMLDCGAWSALNQDVILDNKEYIDFCQQHINKFRPIVSLDVIGNHRETKVNFDELAADGIKSIPTFHIGSPFEYLDYYVSQTDYIGLGGIAAKTNEKQTYSWLRYIFDKCPGCKFHGFGVTNPKLLQSFDWHSVDGTTWITGALRYGRIMYNRGDGTFKWIHVQNQKQLEENWHLIGEDIQRGWDLRNGRTEYYEQVSMRYNAKSLIDLVDYCSKNKRKDGQLFLL